ncbi:MAG: DUF5050 domain-containing protein, partial [Clostridiales bacterium]|nr:DUF5050 domain-containing protein [Clostridiales bacterium]
MLRFRGKKQRGGWTVVSGRRGAAEVFRENRVPFSIAAAVAVAALVAAYLFLAGPPAVLRHTEKGIAYLREWDYPGAITELETADRLSWKRTPKILYPLGRAYLLDARYDDAAAAFQALVALYGADGGDVTSDGGGVAPDDTDVPPDESGNVSPADGDVLPDAGEEGDAGAADDAGDVESSLSRAYYGLAEARAYLEDAQAARAAAEEGYRRTGGAEFLTLMAVIDVRPPVSLTPSGVYNGKFIFHFEAEPAGIRTIYTEDGSPVDAGAINAAEYQGGIEADIGEHSFRAVNINRYGMVSEQAAYDITVLDAAGNLNGNIVNGAHVVSRGEQVYYSNGAGVYREELRSGAEAAGDPGVHKLFEGAQTGGLNLLGEWLYFTRAGGAARGIYRVRIDGTGLAKLTDDAAEYLQIAGSRVYYAAREGLCAITPDGGAREVLFEGSIRCLNYADGKLYFIAENPDADAGASAGGDAADAETDEAGPVYCYETEGGSVTRVVGGNAMFLQLYGGSLYYTAAASNG